MAVENVILDAKINALTDKVTRLEREIDDFEKRDRDRMRAAILTLGGAVLSLGTYIWVHIGGAPRP